MASSNLQQLSLNYITFNAVAAETISGGQFVKPLSQNDVVGAGGLASTLVDAELSVQLMDAAADDELVVGLALTTATSGNPITIATRGQYILQAQAAITAGGSVSPSNVIDAFANSVLATADTEEEFKVGKALTGASASGMYLLVNLNV